MFARIAKVLTVACRPESAQVRRVNSKIQTYDSAGPALRWRRPALNCRWQLDPASGRPVCAWEVESPDLAPDFVPGFGPDLAPDHAPDLVPELGRDLHRPQSLRVDALPRRRTAVLRPAR